MKEKTSTLPWFSLKAELPLASVRALYKAGPQGLTRFCHLSLDYHSMASGYRL